MIDCPCEPMGRVVMPSPLRGSGPVAMARLNDG